MGKLTIKKLKEVLKSGEDFVLKETDDEGIQYLLTSGDTTFLAVKRKWAPEHPASWENWLDLAVISDIRPQDVVKHDIVEDLDDAHQEWLDELEEADLYFNK